MTSIEAEDASVKSLIFDAYGRLCALTRERALPALDAAPIRDYSERPEHDVRNGLLLRSDVHRLFDAGYVRESIAVWEREGRQPDREALAWHNEER